MRPPLGVHVTVGRIRAAHTDGIQRSATDRLGTEMTW
jgi:hypothetical protein